MKFPAHYGDSFCDFQAIPVTFGIKLSTVCILTLNWIHLTRLGRDPAHPGQLVKKYFHLKKVPITSK